MALEQGPAPADAATSSTPSLRLPMTWLLDIDGTLVLTDDIYLSVFKEMMRPHGIEVDVPWYKANVHGKNDREVFSALFPDADAAKLKELSLQKDRCFREQAAKLGMPQVAGLGAALTFAKEQGIRCIAVTNAPRAAGECALASLKASIDAADVIDGLIIGAECERPKPFPDPYVVAMEAVGRPPAECIVFEDSGSGVCAGVAAGVAAVVGIRTSLSDAELRAKGAAHSVEDWREVDAALLNSLLA